MRGDHADVDAVMRGDTLNEKTLKALRGKRSRREHQVEVADPLDAEWAVARTEDAQVRRRRLSLNQHPGVLFTRNADLRPRVVEQRDRPGRAQEEFAVCLRLAAKHSVPVLCLGMHLVRAKRGRRQDVRGHGEGGISRGNKHHARVPSRDVQL